MPKLKDTIRKYWGHVVVALAGIAALIAAITGTPVDEDLGKRYSPAFKEAWERGQALQPSPTTPAE
jgi:hypothetical protein